MNRIAGCLVAGLLAGQTLAFGQSGDVNKVLADARAALGGEKKLAALKTFSATGTQTRVNNNASSAPADFEVAFELPDRYMKKELLAQIGPSAITRTSGFNGEAVINVLDQPPAMAGMIRIQMGPGGAAPGTTPTPEQQEGQRKQGLLSARREFARFALGILAGSLTSYPLQFSYGGQAESPDGKADIVEVKGDGDFAARLFIDAKTHLPLMLSWMAKEPLVMTQTMRSGPGGAPAPAGGANVVQFSTGGGGAQAGVPPTPEEREKLAKEMEQRVKDAEAKSRTVEYRIFYGDYQDVDGLKVPCRIQRTIDGKPTEETVLEKVKINGRIDPNKFQAK